MTFDIDALKNSVQETLEKLYCDYKIDEDGEFYVTSKIAFPSWVAVGDNGFIKIFTYAGFKDGENVDPAAAHKLANTINENLFPNSVYLREGRLWCTYYLPTKDGYSEANFAEMLFRCPASFKQGCNDLDEDNILA
jgi:hypothetical protein